MQRAGGGVRTSVDGTVITAVIDRPEKLNAIDVRVLEGLEDAVGLALKRDASVLVVRGAGGSFSAGADLELLRRTLDDEPAMRSFMRRLGDVLLALEEGTFVSVAAVEGFALAGGLEIVLACDISLAADDAQLGDGHLEHALVPAAGASVRLFRALPKAVASRLLLTGEIVTGRDAARIGLVSAAVEADQLDSALADVLASLTRKSRDALRVAKTMSASARRNPEPTAFAQELALFLEHVRISPDVRDELDRFACRSDERR
jgi:enoyl-CoA hydratase